MKSLVILPYNNETDESADGENAEKKENKAVDIDNIDIENSRFLYLVLPVRLRD
jgi:hypothetical protein